jgi:hypothetical protein
MLPVTGASTEGLIQSGQDVNIFNLGIYIISSSETRVAVVYSKMLTEYITMYLQLIT